jgi:tetratricopeptide (TPR) repeat protein
LKSGHTQEALRCLAEANRVDSNCPLVSWQLGQGLVASGGDAGMAVRALQRALGPKGLAQWARTPDKLWNEAMPGPQRSFVARLTAQQRYVCPVFSNDVTQMVRQGLLALGQAQYRAGNFQEAVSIGEKLLQDSAPSLPVLRGLGLALARLGRYDEAFKHLRAAHDMEEPKTHTTAGYLALCGACGKPSRADDKANNVAWAIRLLSRFNRPGDPEWADLYRRVFGEACAAGLQLAPADLVRACDVLASVEATDADAASVYGLLAWSSLPSVQPLHAWLYCRAAEQHNCRTSGDLKLFELTFRDSAAAQAYFAQRKWDFAEVEAVYLLRWSEAHAGCFPDVLGADYPAKGERLLLARSQQQEAAGQLDAALASAVALVRLAPRSARAYDRWACVEFRRGDLAQAARVLADWQGLHPGDPWPHLRLAVLEQRRGHDEGCTHALERALDLARGPFRADVAFLGARLALTRSVSEAGNAGRAQRYLEECLRVRPDHPGALTWLAAVRWVTGEPAALAAQAALMDRPEVKDARFHYMAGVCHLVAGNSAAVLEVGHRAAANGSLPVESSYLIGLANLRSGDGAAAVAALEVPAQAADSPSTQHARALLGKSHFDSGNYTEAVRWWKQLDAGRRAAWKLDDALRGTYFLAGLQSYGAGQFERAAEFYREAGKQGLRDRRLGPLLNLALFKAGQTALLESKVQSPKPHVAASDDIGHWAMDIGLREKIESAANLLQQAIQVGCKDSAAPYLLALAHKRQGKIADARAALRRIGEPDAGVWVQLGLLSLKEKQLEQAEQEFAKAWELDPRDFTSGANLLMTRLSLGQVERAAAMAARVADLARGTDDKRLFTILHALLATAQSSNGDARPHAALAEMSPADERALLGMLRGLGNLDTVCLLLRVLAASRPNSGDVSEAHFEAVLLKGKKLLDRGEWDTVERLLTALARQREVAPATLAALFNLLGCSACLSQDFEDGVRYLSAAARLSPADAGIHQNLALAYEWQKDLAQAEPHWSRFFDLLERRKQQQPVRADYFSRLAHEGLHRLAGCYTEKEKWGNALPHVERAQRIKPDDVDTLERLFHIYCQVRRTADARRVLQQLRYQRPGEPQYELYELDLVELREIDDIDRWISDIGQIVQRHTGEARVEERAVTMIGNAVPLLGKLSDQLTEQVNKVIRQVRSLQNYQVNWQAVHDVMRDLKREFQKLRKTLGKCLTVVTHPDHRRVLRDLATHVDRKIEFCREWQGN